MKKKNKIAIVIPSLEPDSKFIDYLKDIKEAGADYVVVVDDGNKPIYKDLFKEVKSLGCVVLKHGVNCGKGRSFKTAFNYILCEMENVSVVVTADGDGTYLPEDIINVANNTKENTITIGCRDFNDEKIGRNTRNSNAVTSFLIKTLSDISMSDTQSSLRAFNRELLPYMITVNGERYDYDFNMIFEKKNIDLLEIPVTTTRRISDRKSHFRPLKDTLSVTLTFLAFIVVSLSSTILDLILYSFFINMFIDAFPILYISISTFLARVVSDFYNYYFDKTLVFKSKESSSLGRYAILCVCKTAASALGVTLLVMLLKDGEIWIKLFVDTVIFFVAYKIEKNWVHKSK